MWLLLLVVMLQAILIMERILYRLLVLFVGSQRTGSKKLADNTVLGSCVSSIIFYVTLPVQLVVGMLDIVFRNLTLYVSIVIICCLMFMLGQHSVKFFVGYITTYNAGIGQTLDLYLKLLQLPNLLFKYTIPVYNAMVYAITQLLLYVVVPFSRLNIDEFPQLIENLTMVVTALIMSFHTFCSNLLSCVTDTSIAANNNTVVFLPPQAQCYANVHHYQFDLMTPGIYCRKSVLTVKQMFMNSCGPAGVMVELVLFPLLDFNVYKTIHCLINSLLHMIVVMPVMTYQRCQYGKTNTLLTRMEKDMMCVPDFSVQYALAVNMIKAAGNAVDNWLNVALALAEQAITGAVKNTCVPSERMRVSFDRASGLFGVPSADLKIVGMTDKLFAITDGVSTEYHSTTDTLNTEMAIGNWPFHVDVKLGVAAVQHGEVGDVDDDGDARSGMLGCRCYDTTDYTGKLIMQIMCASVPYTVHESNMTEYNTSTIHAINFAPPTAVQHMSCSNTKIKISSLRFSKKRMSRGYQDMDGDYLDPFNTMGTSGMQRSQTFQTDAAIYVQPHCGDGTSLACISNADNCFPWCMGLHVAGQAGQNITLYNARRWDEYLDVRQFDCAITPQQTLCLTTAAMGLTNNEQFGVKDAPACSQTCVPDYNTESFMSIAQTSLNTSTFLQQKPMYPTVRMQQQPFVMAGDIMLVEDAEGNVIINRLWDESQGLFSVQGEQLTLMSNEKTVDMLLVDACSTQDDAACHSEAAKNNQIVKPTAYSLMPNDETPTAVSEFGVHWAVNPDASVLGEKYDMCSGAGTGEIVITSSYGKARVWTLRPVRASSAQGMYETALVSYMVVPNWMHEDTPCHEMVNQKVVDLEFLNTDNILITTYRAAPQHYDWRTNSVCEGCPFAYETYFLHPNRQDCVEPQESEGAHFSCWQASALGMFRSPDLPVSDMFGALCPSMRKMPHIGMAAAEVTVAGFSLLKIILDLIVVLPVAWTDLSEIFQLRINRLTFHSILDTNGASFFDVDQIVNSLDRAAMLTAQALPKLGNLLRNEPGHETLQPMLIGTAKILQFHPQVNVIQNQLSGVLLRQFNEIMAPLLKQFDTAMKAIPTDKILTSASSLMGRHLPMTSSATPPTSIRILSTLRRILSSSTSTLSMNVRLAKVLISRMLLRPRVSSSITQLFSLTLYEMQFEIHRSYLESIRIQCDGLGQIVGRNVWGEAIKETCLVIPASLGAVLQALLVFLVDYSTMDCVCRHATEVRTVTFIESQCLPQDKPIALQAFTMDVMRLDGQNSAGMATTQTCYRQMDLANNRLITAFDPVFNHMFRATEHIGSSLDYMLSVFDIDAGNCANYQTSPYVLALLPDPADYFMSCMHTSDCRIKCLDTYQAFENAKNAMTTLPSQTLSSNVDVESRFFSDDVVEKGLDQPPFAIYGMAELHQSTCSVVCGENQPDDRCVVIAGVHSNSRRLGLAYYCMPHNFMDSVYEYNGPDGSFHATDTFYQDTWEGTEMVSNIYIMTIDTVLEGRHEMLLVSTQDNANVQNLWVFTSDGDRFFLAGTEDFDMEVTNSRALHSITSVRVLPGQRQKDIDHAEVYVQGTRLVLDDVNDVQEQIVCVRYMVFLDNFLKDVVTKEHAFAARIVPFHNEGCLDRHYDAEHKIVCLDDYCTRQLRIPLGEYSDAAVLHRDYSVGMTETSYVSLSISNNLPNLINLDPSYALISLESGGAAINRRFIADLSPRSLETCTSTPDVECLNLILVGRVSVQQSWLHNIYLELQRSSTSTNSVKSRLLGGVLRQQIVTTQIDCSVDSCGGCASSARSAAEVDLQNKCYAAANCAVGKCVGTRVNLRRPLCNMGQHVASVLDMTRVGLHGGWLAAANMIVVTVELSEQRRQEYRITFPQEVFTSTMCNAKDTIVEGVSILTSVGGGVLSVIHNKRLPGLSYDANDAALDVRVHGKQIMFVAALTNFLSSIFMAPLYVAIALAKTIDCRVDSFLVILNRFATQAGSDVLVLRGTAEQDELTDYLVGMCMSKYGDVAALDAKENSNVGAFVSQILTDVQSLKKSYFFEPWIHGIDAGIAWVIGVVTGAMDMAQVIDWDNCKLPVTSMKQRGRCACEDKAMTIPAPQRHAMAGVGSHAFWCSGLLLLTNIDGSDLLIWNKYSLDQLLHTDRHGGSGNYNQFLQCLSTADTNCQQYKPQLPDLAAQGVEVMQVVTRCRANYQQKKWDDGALLLGLHTHDEWHASSGIGEFQRLETAYSEASKRLQQISQWITYSGEIVDSETLDCLTTALRLHTSQMTCTQHYLWYSQQAAALRLQSIDTYFSYQPYGVTTDFVNIDSCESFSGDIGIVDDNTQISYPLMLWTGNSANKVPVAEYHFKNTGADEQRQTYGRSMLEELLLEIQQELQTIPPELPDEIAVTSWSVEGDLIHQLVDCVVLGPYASADMQSSFDLPGGRALPVQQYHRGDPTSRRFFVDADSSGGSNARQHIVHTAQEFVQDVYTEGLQNQFQHTLNSIRFVYENIENLMCTCPVFDTRVSDMSCCTAKDLADIDFKAKDKFSDIWNIREDMNNFSLTALTESNLLKSGIWTNDRFVYEAPVSFTAAEKQELLDKYVFDEAHAVFEYSANEIMTDFTQETLWARCTELISMSFFSMPVKVDEEGEFDRTGELHVDANMIYDPTIANPAFLHGMEAGIQQILERSRKDSPVYWTHIHRYLPSDSVWCEDLNVNPTKFATIPNADYNAEEYEAGRAHDTVRANSFDDTVFVANVPEYCFCGWHNGSVCAVPACWNVNVSEPLLTAWRVLCARGTYSSREDLFTILQVVQETSVYDPAWFDTCSDMIPSVTWGLLDSEQHRTWFEQLQDDYKPNLHELGVQGPAGLRLGLLGRETDSLLTWVKKHKLLQRHPDHLPYNFAHNHTIAQPYCKANGNQVWRDDLTEYFRDVFFPMAHTIHTSAVGAYCSTWVIEYAIEKALWHIHGGNPDHDEVVEQQNRVSKWKERCDIQLQQIGICELRGVFDMIPDNYTAPAHCPFTIAQQHGCTSLIYTTQNCMVMCDGLFYDPCRCELSGNCENAVFQKECPPLSFNPRQFSQNAAVKLHSMHWPNKILEEETVDQNTDSIDTALEVIRDRLRTVTFESEQLHRAIQDIIVNHDQAQTEGNSPDAFCDDLTDYFDGTAQHPVGYHPTSACNHSKTHLRGFDAWMYQNVSFEEGVEAGWTVDQTRLRNMTLYSTTYGTSHLVCDAAVYGAYGHQLNPFYLNTRWDENAKADPAVPLYPSLTGVDTMRTVGTPSRNSEDTAIVSDDLILKHSVGLIRDWLRTHGDDADLQASLNQLWPRWYSEREDYGLYQDEAVTGCPPPPLLTCTTDVECNHDVTGLICLKPAIRNGVQENGICANASTCYMHEHCPASTMCSAEGRCVQPYVIINNRDFTDKHIQLFAVDSSDCQDSMHGISEGQQVPDFAHANGMCNLRNWFMYENITNQSPKVDNLRLVPADTLERWPELTEDISVRDKQTLFTTPHACDRTYQHSLNFCDPNKLQGINEANGDSVSFFSGIRTYTKDDVVRFCDMPDSTLMTGLLNPYRYHSENGVSQDTLQYLPQTVKKCSQFEVCQAQPFYVNGKKVTRKVLQVETLQLSGNVRPYWIEDARICFGVGYRIDSDCVSPNECFCVVDRWTMPLLQGLFASFMQDGVLTQSSTYVPLKTTLQTGDGTWSDVHVQAMFDSIRSHCSLAFSNTVQGRTGIDLFYQYLAKLSRPYSNAESSRVDVTWFANTLLSSLFGIDVNKDVITTRGIADIDDYVAKSKCAAFLRDAMQQTEDIVLSTFNRPYPVESIEEEPLPGQSLYMFHDRAVISLDFHWFWKCVVIAKDTEGGAAVDWFDRMTNAAYRQEELSCSNLLKKPNAQLSLREKLQLSDVLFEYSGDLGSELDNLLLDDINAVMQSVLNTLKLTMLPNTYCAKCDSDCAREDMKLNMFHKDTCWVKTGFNAQNERVEVTIHDQPNQQVVISLYRQVYQQLLGSINPEQASIATLKAGNDPKITETTLDTEVLGTDNFFPMYTFTHLNVISEPPPPFELDVDECAGATDLCACVTDKLRITPAYLVPTTKCVGMDTLNEFEFTTVDDTAIEIGTVARKYITQEEALWLVQRMLRTEVYNSAAMKSLNLQQANELTAQMMKLNPVNPSSMEQRVYNAYLADITFACGNTAGLDTDHQNDAHLRMRQCVSDLKVDIGWQMQSNDRLRLRVKPDVLMHGFFPSFSTTTSSKFLDDLTSDTITDDPRERICFTDLRTGNVHTLSPLWSGDYGVTACGAEGPASSVPHPACGCNTRINEANPPQRVVDMRCVNPQQCTPGSGYYEWIHNKLPIHCQELGEDIPVTMRRGTLPSSQIPLCDRQITVDSECTGAFGTLHGHRGTTVTDLYFNLTTPSFQAGLFERSNSVFRRRHTDRFVPNLVPTALRILGSDIAGHGLEFGIGVDGNMHLDCVHLGNDNTCSEEHSWLANVEDTWKWRHRRQEKMWDPDSTVGASVSWKCPLMWWSAYSNHSKTFAARTPEPRRNQQRFRHITGEYNSAHPVVESVRRHPGLRAARFMADNRACADDSCHGHLSGVIADMYAMARQEWRVVQLDGDTHQSDIVDWPHSTFTLFDDPDTEYGEEPELSVLGRLPKFRIRYEEHSKPVSVSKPASVELAGVCHMQHLPHIVHRPWPSNRILHMCTHKDNLITCKYTEGTECGYETFIYNAQQLNFRAATTRHRRCSQCDTYQGNFINRSMHSTVSSGSTSLLSVGEPIHISTERMVAQYLRTRVCPEAAHDCAALQTIFDTSKWQRGVFLKELLQADNASDFFRQWLNPPNASVEDSVIDDAILWSRPWVYCDQTSQNLGCQGSITKQDWLDVNERFMQCKQKVLQAQPVTSPPVQFCLLSGDTERLCEKVAQWNQRILDILCRATGLTECPEYGFFYVPTMYAVENKQFVSETVQQFYSSLDAAACPVETLDDSIQQQIDSNEEKRDNCASVQLEVVREVLVLIRGMVGKVFRIVYFAMMLGWQMWQIIIGSFIPGDAGAALVQSATSRMIRYVGSLMEAVAGFFKILLEAIWKMLVEQTGSFGKRLMDIIRAICVAINFVKVEILCPFFKVVIIPLLEFVEDMVNEINKLIGTVTFGGAKLSNPIKPFKEKVVQWVYTSLCKRMDCSMSWLEEEETGSGTLPVPTRCWASYLTFYGDTSVLGCTRADTCRAGMTDTDLTVCAQCTAFNANYDSFACSPLTKLCTCNVQRYQQTPCLNNDQCQQEDAHCLYLRGDYSFSDTATPCSTCQTERVCYLDVFTDERFCACGLFALQFSTCVDKDIGQSVLPNADKLCLYQADSKFARTSTYTVRHGDLLTTSCIQNLDLSNTYCMRVLDRPSSMIVGVSVNTARRRLLSADDVEAVSWNITRNSVCRDVLRRTDMLETKSACVKAIVKSRHTVQALGLNHSVCLFCSFEDFWYHIQNNPKILKELMIRPHALRYIASNYGPSKHVIAILQRQMQWVEVLMHGIMTRPSIMSQFNNINQESHTGQRRLLGLFDIVERIEEQFETVHKTHKDYATQLASAYDYSYAETDTTYTGVWREQWPPQFVQPESEASCQSLYDTIDVLANVINITAQPYLRRDLQKKPVVYLRDAWPKLGNHSVQLDTPAHDTSDVIEKYFVRMLVWVLNWVGVDSATVQNAYTSLLREVQTGVRCDFYAVQTCSRWNVKLLHGIVIMTCYFSLWMIFWNTMKQPLVVAFTFPLFTLMVMYLCYGYSPMCVPMVPICLVEDVLHTLQFFFPKYLFVPTPMIKTSEPNCDPSSLFPEVRCVKDCLAVPLGFDNWKPVFAWGLVEIGGVVQTVVVNHVHWIPFMDHQRLRDLVIEKEVVLERGGDDMVNANRLCAVVNLYRLAPYLLIFFLLLSSAVTVSNLVPMIINPNIQIFTQLYVAIFAE
tara:strand:- start:10377 stop:28151 length:17775 start_codon:yes stop_codon:yes gene_type:complete